MGLAIKIIPGIDDRINIISLKSDLVIPPDNGKRMKNSKTKNPPPIMNSRIGERSISLINIYVNIIINIEMVYSLIVDFNSIVIRQFFHNQKDT